MNKNLLLTKNTNQNNNNLINLNFLDSIMFRFINLIYFKPINTRKITPLYVAEESFNTTSAMIIASFYMLIGIISTMILVFVILIYIKYASNKKGIYTLIKITVLFEIIVAIHLAKSGLTIFIGISNSIVCKVDAGAVYYSIILYIYYSMVIMILLLENKSGEFPKISNLKRNLINIPAIFIALVIVIIILNYKLTGLSSWQTCFLKKDSDINVLFFYIPLILYILLCIYFFTIVLVKKTKLIGVLKDLHIFNLLNSISYLGIIINTYVENTYWIGSISLILFLINVIYFRLSSDIIIKTFENNQITKNKMFFFLATVLNINTPPIESTKLDIREDHRKIVEEYQKKKDLILSSSNKNSDRNIESNKNIKVCPNRFDFAENIQTKNITQKSYSFNPQS